MTNRLHRWLLALAASAALVVLLVGLAPAAAQEDSGPLLVFGKTAGFRHSSIPIGSTAVCGHHSSA
jgi:hypothetical protein